MKINILQITQATVGGVYEYLKLLVEKIDRSKFNITIVCPKIDESHIAKFNELGIRVHIIQMEREICISKDFRAVIQLVKFIKDNKFDIVHLHSSKAGAIGRIACFLCRIPCIYTPHGWAFNMDITSIKKKLYIYIERFLGLFTKYIIAISPAEKYNAVNYKIGQERKIILITNGIDIKRFSKTETKKYEFRRYLGIEPSVRVIGMVGRLSEQKDPITFVKVAKKIISKYSNVRFILVGDGELRHDVEVLIKKEGISDYITITGWVSNVEQYISIFDIGVLTSKWEGFGLVLAEYMAAKVPVVASNVDGIPNVITNGVTGILVEKGDVDEFANAILKILDNKTLKDSFTQNGYKKVVDEFDINRVIKQHEELYSSLISD